MFDKLDGVEKRYKELERKLGDPDALKDFEKYQGYAREHADLGKVVTAYQAYKQAADEMDGSMELLKDDDPEIKKLARDEIDALNAKRRPCLPGTCSGCTAGTPKTRAGKQRC